MNFRAAIVAVAALATSQAAFAVGGNDADPGTKVNSATRACQAEIAKKRAIYASKAAKAMNDCLDGIVVCDEQADAAKALSCRRGLLRPGRGKCAQGKVDEGASLLGAGSAAHADTVVAAGSRAALPREMDVYAEALQKKCIATAGVDLASVATGLGFTPVPTDKSSLADANNQDPGGIGCLANGLGLRTHPLANDITSLVEGLHQTCVASDTPGLLGTPCTTMHSVRPRREACAASSPWRSARAASSSVRERPRCAAMGRSDIRRPAMTATP